MTSNPESTSPAGAGRAYRYYRSLPNHLEKKEDKLSYECDTCNRTFDKLSKLKVHLRTHNGERPFKCHVCQKGFNRLGHLKNHYLVHTREKPHQCGVCKKSFSTASNLRTHLRLHSGEKPYECKLCSAKFAQLVQLKRHIRRRHTNKIQFICHNCGNEYKFAAGLRSHWKTTSCRPRSEDELNLLESINGGGSGGTLGGGRSISSSGSEIGNISSSSVPQHQPQSPGQDGDALLPQHPFSLLLLAAATTNSVHHQHRQHTSSYPGGNPNSECKRIDIKAHEEDAIQIHEELDCDGRDDDDGLLIDESVQPGPGPWDEDGL